MDVPLRPGDPLSQPTRARLFELLGELRRPAPTDELADRLGMHPNGVRVHLERLRDAGLVQRRREHIARGRPRDTWTVSPHARPGGDPPTGYAALSRWLVRSLVSGGVHVRDVEETGRRIGRGLAGDDEHNTGGEQQLFGVLTSLGFAPQRERVGRDRVMYRLCNCPYREAVHERQPLVCGLHRGLTRGLLDAIDPDARLVAFEAKDPDRAGCLIRVRGPIARDTPAEEMR
jgi:predicted ArsR family transcriptional regulator